MLSSKSLEEHVLLAPLTTMKVGGSADFMVKAKSENEVKEACDFATKGRIPIFVLGEGSNIVVSDEPIHRLVIKVEIMGVTKESETKDKVVLKIGAGEHWDSVVRRTVELGLSGVEAMSMIPGTAGAAPVQNAGAYGEEIKDTFVELTAYDIPRQEFVRMNKEDCEFEYRSSIFKTSAIGRYVITSVTLELSKKQPKQPTYESLKKYLDQNHIENPDVRQIRDGVMEVRRRILPDPSVVPSCGSFFKSPIVSAAKLKEIEKQYKKVPSYPYDGKFKIAAGWLVEQCGFKGSEHFGLKVWESHALVITNPNHATSDQLLQMVRLITDSVNERFGIVLEPEPQFISS
jgi:UDP-N-acetylmuramate dehydrogenase